MNGKAVLNLNQRLQAISENTFEEDDIKLLLIEIRDYLQNESILREVCDFIAHPKRNRGICHKRIDSRYAKQILAKKRTEELIKEGVFQKNPEKPWNFFSDQILDYIETSKVDRKLFETVILEGINEIDENSFQKYYRLNKDQVRSTISKFYVQNNNGYRLKEGFSKDEYFFIDDLLKFIRGTFTGKSAFDQKEVEDDLVNAIVRLAALHSLSIDIPKLRNGLPDIVVCILCIIHDTDFILFDEKRAKSYLSVHEAHESGRFNIGLVVNADNFIFQIISTSIDVLNYLPTMETNIEELSMKPLPWCCANRDEHSKLLLTRP
jgi:hypothetical protein